MENNINTEYNIDMKTRVIALVDCDSFFVSCEQADNPTLKNTPTCVISGPNGCVLSRSREAKKVGVRMGMPMFMAKKEFPKVNYICADHSKYHKYSKKVMACLYEYSPDIEVVSIDEAYIDLTGVEKLFSKTYQEIVKDLRNKILQETDIPVSIGLSHSKILAKLASDKAKNTGGFYQIEKKNILSELKKTEINEVCGIGYGNNAILKRNGIILASEFVEKDDLWLKSKLGVNGVELRHELLGECISKVNPKSKPPQSIQDTSMIGEGTFSSDINILKMELSRHIHNACSRLRFYKGQARTVGVLLRSKDFAQYYDKKNLLKSTDFELTIQKTVNELFQKLYKNDVLYRSTGIVLDNLSYDGEQLSLFESTDDSKERSLSKCIEKIENKFGKNAIRTGF